MAAGKLILQGVILSSNKYELNPEVLFVLSVLLVVILIAVVIFRKLV